VNTTSETSLESHKIFFLFSIFFLPNPPFNQPVSRESNRYRWLGEKHRPEGKKTTGSDGKETNQKERLDLGESSCRECTRPSDW
jgi:hypothetical protein